MAEKTFLVFIAIFWSTNLFAAANRKPSDVAVISQDPNQVQPHIEALKAGKVLQPKVSKKTKNGAGLLANLGTNFNVGSSKQEANNFDKVYTPGDKYAIGFNLFYEYHWLRHPTWGTFGPIGHLSIISLKGKGLFTNLGTKSDDVTYNFYTTPLTVGASYRFTAMRLFVPFVNFGPTAIPMYEKRDDGGNPRRAISAGHTLGFGGSLNLDWISRSSWWDSYDSNGILHSYLIFQRQMLKTETGNVSFNFTSNYLGLMFDI